MKKNVKNIVGSVVFVGLALIMLYIISYIMRPYASGSNRDTFSGYYAEEENTLDVVAIGSSSVYRFINTPYLWENFGITSYNFATSSQQGYVVDERLNVKLNVHTPSPHYMKLIFTPFFAVLRGISISKSVL